MGSGAYKMDPATRSRIDVAMGDFCDAALKIRSYDEFQRSPALQRVNACVQVVNTCLAAPSFVDDPRSSTSTSLLTESHWFQDFINRVPAFLLEMVSGMYCVVLSRGV